MPIVKKNDVYYGNENDDEIQNQPYILIRKRMPVSNAIDLALSEGMSKDKTEYIIGDNDNHYPEKFTDIEISYEEV